MPASEAQPCEALEQVEQSGCLPGMRFVSLGRAGAARWLVPEGHALGRNAFSGWEPYRLTSRMAWAAMKSALHWPRTRRLLPSRETAIEWLGELDWQALGWRGPSPPYPLVYLGTPGAKRKAVVHLIDRTTKRCDLIVKVPLTEAARRAIRQEAQTLLELQQAGFTSAPRLVAFDPAAYVSSQTVVPGKRCGLKLSREVWVLLQSLLRPCEATTLRDEMLPLRRAGLGKWGANASLVADAFDQLDDETELPAARLHGDFAPWNIKLHNGSAALVDWEEYSPRGLPLHDAYHFMHMTRYLFGKPPQPCWPHLRFRYAEPLSTVTRWKLELAYLLRSLAAELAENDHKHAAFMWMALRLTMLTRP